MKIKDKLPILIGILFSVFFSIGQAQGIDSQNKSEKLLVSSSRSLLSLSIGGGWHGLDLRGPAERVENMQGFGFSANLDYLYKFHENWGISIGFGYSFFSSQTQLSISEQVQCIDIEENEYILYADIDCKEKQSFHQLLIPVRVCFETSIIPNLSLLGKAGVNVFIPIEAGYKIPSGKATFSAYYPEFDLLYDELEWLGYGTYDNFSTEGKIRSQIHVGAAIDIGIHVLSTQRFRPIYIGLYANIGLSSVVATSSDPLFKDSKTYSGWLNSSMVSKARAHSFGVKVGLPLWSGGLQ